MSSYKVLSFDTTDGLEQNKIKCCVELCCGHVVTVPKTVMAFMNNDTQCIQCIKKGHSPNKKTN